MYIPQRRGKVAAVVALCSALAIGISGCGSSGSAANSSGGDGASGDQVSLRFAWWGGDARHKYTQQLIDTFEASHPNVTITGEFGEFGGYWDKLATGVAAKDTPDVIQMDEKYLRDYASRGVLLDLTTQSGVLSTAKFDENALKSGQFDGGLYGLTTGVNAYSIVANPALFEAAGVELPDDTTWTWDDYTALCAEITAQSPEGTYGCQAYGNEEAGLSVWARQHGESLYTDDGQIGFKPQTLAAWWTQLIAMRDAKATPPPSFTSDEATAPLDQSGTGTNTVAMGLYWTNQIPALEAASGSTLTLLRQPSLTGKAADNGMYYKSSMFWSASSQTEHPTEVAEFINFLANSPDAGTLLGIDRGAPSNTEIRALILPTLPPTNKAAVEFTEAIGKDITTTPAPPPVGGGAVIAILQRYTSEVLFDRMTPDEAATAFIDEVKAATNQG